MDPNDSSEAENCEFTKDLSDPASTSQLLVTQMEKMFSFYITPTLAIFGLIGNSVLLLSVFRIKAMRTKLNIIVSNLAVADMGFLLTNVFWNILIRSFSPIRFDVPFLRSALGDASCTVMPLTLKLWVMASLGFITQISYERYLAMCKPIQYRLSTTATHTGSIVAAVWVLAVIISSITSAIPVEKHIKYCLQWPDGSKHQNLPVVASLCIAQSTTGAAVNGFLTIIIYGTVFSINCILCILTLRSLWNRRSIRNKVEKIKIQVTRTLIVNSIVFFICQMPLFLFQVDVQFDDAGGKFDLLKQGALIATSAVGGMFSIINSCINPYLFLLLSSHYRKAMCDALRDLLCGLCGDHGVGKSESNDRRNVSDETLVIGNIPNMNVERHDDRHNVTSDTHI